MVIIKSKDRYICRSAQYLIFFFILILCLTGATAPTHADDTVDVTVVSPNTSIEYEVDTPINLSVLTTSYSPTLYKGKLQQWPNFMYFKVTRMSDNQVVFTAQEPFNTTGIVKRTISVNMPGWYKFEVYQERAPYIIANDDSVSIKPFDYNNFNAQTSCVFKVIEGVPVPTEKSVRNYTYDGLQKTGYTYSDARFKWTGTTSETKAGTYKITAVLKDKERYQWSDGTTSDKRFTWTINRASISKGVVSGVKDTFYTGKRITPNPILKIGKTTLKQGVDYSISYSKNQNVGTATITIKGMGNYTASTKTTFKIKRVVPSIIRIEGADRYKTALATAKAYKKDANKNKLTNVIIANGSDKSFPDALSASYLSKKYKAPILITDGGNEKNKAVINWIKKNVNPGQGRVFFVGGKYVLPEALKNKISSAGYRVKRIAGPDRIGTNIETIQFVGLDKGSEVLVADGWSPYNALIASATGKPVLLVNKSGLTKEQKRLVKGKKLRFTVIGNASSVPSSVEKMLKQYGETERVKARNLDSLSVAVAKKYWPNGPNKVFIATSKTFPDALTGGAECILHKGPLFLVSENAYKDTKTYVNKLGGVNTVTVFGGTKAVPDRIGKEIAGK